MSGSRDALRRIVEAFERSDWSEIDVRSGDLRVHLSTSGRTSAPVTEPGQPDRPPERSVPAMAPVSPSAVAAAEPPPDGAHLVVSPSPGIFWRSPEPGRPPFAEVGDTVEASATVCIIEVMKLMNHVKAGVVGDVFAVYCEDGAAVQKGEVLLAIAPFEPS